MLILNKVDLVDEEKVDQLDKELLKLQLEAKLIRTSYGIVKPTEIMNTNLFDFNKVSSSPGWLKELLLGSEDYTPETEVYGILIGVQNTASLEQFCDEVASIQNLK